MSLLDTAKNTFDKAKDAAADASGKISAQADIAKQRIEGEVDKAKGDDLKGNAKVKTSQIRDKFNR